MTYYIGVDGGGTKTECILVDQAGEVCARHIAGGSNPSSAGAKAGQILLAALYELRRQASVNEVTPAMTLLCMAGSLAYWTEFAAQIVGFGKVVVFDDSLPVLELATGGQSGMVLHAGTGSFVAAYDRRGIARYAGGFGWRFGDQGSAYDLGRRAVTRVLLERQGWAESTRLGALLTQSVGTTDYAELTRLFYGGSNPTETVARLAPIVIRAFQEGDAVATEIALASAFEFLNFGVGIAKRLFGSDAVSSLQVGVSGRFLNSDSIFGPLAARAPFRLRAIADAPAEGVRRMLLRLNPPGSLRST